MPKPSPKVAIVPVAIVPVTKPTAQGEAKPTPQDHLVHKFGHRVVRRTLLFFGIPDGRCSEKQRHEEQAVLMTASQANGIQNMHTGPEVVAVGSNPMIPIRDLRIAWCCPAPPISPVRMMNDLPSPII